MPRSIQKSSNKSPANSIEWLNCEALVLTHCWNTWSFSRWMNAPRDKESKKHICCCCGCLRTVTWKHDCVGTKLISVGFPFHQQDCLLDLTNVPLYLSPLFFLSMQIFEAVGERCHFWSNVLKRWKCLPDGNYVLLHGARLLFSSFALQLARAVSADNKIFTLQGHLSSGTFCQCWHLRASILSKLQRSNLSRRDREC